ncbi:9673_t:CDS:2, partial [Cetraspora pellucida]
VSDSEDEEYNVSLDHRSSMTTSSSSSQSSKDNHSMLQRTIFDNQQARQFTRDDNIQGVQGQETNESNNSYNFIPSKKRHYQTLQDISNNPKYQHNIYRQIANKNLVDYRSKMKNQMHARYNIHECIYKVGDLVKIQIAKIDRGPGDRCALLCKVFSVLPNNMYNLICRFGILKNAFLASEVLPLGPKEFPELDNPPTDTTISIIEAARLQSISLASNKGCNCRDDCLTARCLCRKVNTLCGSGCHTKNSKCKHRA